MEFAIGERNYAFAGTANKSCDNKDWFVFGELRNCFFRGLTHPGSPGRFVTAFH